MFILKHFNKFREKSNRKDQYDKGLRCYAFLCFKATRTAQRGWE